MACTVLLCYSCGGNNPQTTSGYSEYEKPDTTNSVQEMKDYHYSAEVKVGQTRYTYDIVREVNDTLPLVTGDDGERYADNYIRLRVNREGKEIFNKVFTKNHFRSYMEKGFISHAISHQFISASIAQLVIQLCLKTALHELRDSLFKQILNVFHATDVAA